MNIEDTIFDEGLPVNTIAMLNRLIGILKAANTNAYESLSEESQLKYKMALWLVNQQVFGQTGSIDMIDEWREYDVATGGENRVN